MTTEEARRFRASTDRRLLIVYIVLCLILAAGLAFFAHAQRQANIDRHRFEQSIIANCERNQDNTESFNTLVDGLIQAVETSTLLTDEQIQIRVELYRAAHQNVPACPPTR